MRTVALDLGVRKITYCEVHDGLVVARATARSLRDLEPYLGADAPRAAVAFEACREAWWIHDELAARGHLPLMLDTTRVRQIGVGQHGRKTDRLDAEALARALARGGVPRAHVLSPARRQMRAELSTRSALVETRSQYVTTVRGLVRAAGVLLPTCAPESFVRHARAANLTPETRALLEPLLAVLDAIAVQFAVAETRLESLARTEPVVALLATVPGVGLIVASTFVATLDEAGRFRDAHSVQAYLGLVPNENSSGGQRRLGAITKQGNPWARVALVQAAHSILRAAPSDDPLRMWALDVATRRGKPIAVVALARRLAGVLWAMWRDDRPYMPQRLAARSAAGLDEAGEQIAARAARLAAVASAEHKIYPRTRPSRKPAAAPAREVPRR
ncbi:MAG: IS110 family transposase [Deltaproteobacteria bacterium]|nr:IS110 family transposase [Deltaproteobacteria bacterium]